MVPDQPPQFSAAVLTNSNTMGPTFKPGQAGIYVATLTVNDGKFMTSM
jgi:hypothetical protein